MEGSDVLAWAEKNYPDVVTKKFREDPPSGLTLSMYNKEDFKEDFGNRHGAAFYNAFVKQGTHFFAACFCPSAPLSFLRHAVLVTAPGRAFPFVNRQHDLPL